mgnify:CR=1 FL=1
MDTEYVTLHTLTSYTDKDGKLIENCGSLPSFSKKYLPFDKAVYPGMLDGNCTSEAVGYPNPIGTGEIWVHLRGRIVMDIFNKSAWVPPTPPNKTTDNTPEQKKITPE